MMRADKIEDLFQDPLEATEIYGCSICGETFTKFAHRDLHELQVHSDDGWVPIPSIKKGKLNNHKLIVHSSKEDAKAQCDECDKSYSNKENLNRHKLTKHSKLMEHQRREECDECDSSFSNKENLIRHKSNQHPESGDYQCRDCPGKFTRDV